MAILVRTAAVSIGFASATVFALIPDKPLKDAFSYFLGDLSQWPAIVLYAILAIGAGLLISAIVLEFMQSGLHGSFFARYGVMALAVCLGGVLWRVFLFAAMYSFEDYLTMTKRITWALSRILPLPL